jgi:signal peptidase
MKKINKILNVVYTAVSVLLLFIAGVTVLSALGLPQSLRFFVVQTGSMEPSIKTGSLVLVQPASIYSKDDVVTFHSLNDKDAQNRKTTITHRIANVEVNGSTTLYTTKGDANKTTDFIKIEKNVILGKVILTVPFLGYPVNYAKSQTGFILLIIIPATLIIFSELLNIKNEAIKLIREKKKRKLTMQEEIEEKIGEKMFEVEGGIKEILDK